MSVVTDASQGISEIVLPPEPAMPLWPLSVEKYHEMVRQGILTEDDPVELLEGLLVRKMPKSRSHCLATELVREAIGRSLPQGWHVEGQESITLLASEPEPDMAVVRGAPRDYTDRHPGPGDVALVVEVSDSSLHRDQGFKKSIYAKSGIPAYWILNLVGRRLEVYSDPTGPAQDPDYRRRNDFGEADQVPLVLEDREVARLSVGAILP
jgi:hypothetical protein